MDRHEYALVVAVTRETVVAILLVWMLLEPHMLIREWRSGQEAVGVQQWYEEIGRFPTKEGCERAAAAQRRPFKQEITQSILQDYKCVDETETK